MLMRKLLVALAALFVLLTATAARADFVLDNTTLPPTKSNLRPIPGGADPTKYIQASDYNALMNAIDDLRTAIVEGQYFGFSLNSVRPIPVVAQNYFWAKTDHTLHFFIHDADYLVPFGPVCSNGQALLANSSMDGGYECISVGRLGVAGSWTKAQTIANNGATFNAGGTTTVDLSASSSQSFTMNGNTAIALSNLASGSDLSLELIQDGTGSRTVTSWDAAIHWASGSAPTLTTTAGKADIVTCHSFNGTTMICNPSFQNVTP